MVQVPMILGCDEDDNWFRNGTSCYRMFNDIPRDVSEYVTCARQLCHSHDAELVTIADQAENEFVWSLFKKVLSSE